MLIDWFTVIAQTANFLILVWLMKRYLYHPILTAIDAREARIAARLKDAETKKSEAATERDLFQQKNQALDASRDSMMKTAQDGANAERQKLLEAARKDADALRDKFDAAVDNERSTLNRAVAERVQQEVFAIMRQTLANLATIDVEAQMGKVFIDRLHTLDAQAKETLTAALQAAPQSALVRSAFVLPAPQREAIQHALKELCGVEAVIQFTTSPGLVCGIELGINGQKLAWSVDDYLHSLDNRMNALLASAAKTVTTQPKTDTAVSQAP